MVSNQWFVWVYLAAVSFSSFMFVCLTHTRARERLVFRGVAYLLGKRVYAALQPFQRAFLHVAHQQAVYRLFVDAQGLGGLQRLFARKGQRKQVEHLPLVAGGARTFGLGQQGEDEAGVQVERLHQLQQGFEVGIADAQGVH